MLEQALNFTMCSMPIWVAPLLIATGAIAGLLAGLIGVGGGIIIVPVVSTLLTLNGIPTGQAVGIAIGTSLLSIFPSACASTLKHARNGNVDWRFLKTWGPAIFIGSYLGATIVSKGHSMVAMASFALLCVLFSAYLLSSLSQRGLWDQLPRSFTSIMAIGVGIGGWSGAAGVGGGLVSTALMTTCSVPLRLAIGTSAAVGMFVAFPGAIASIFGAQGSDPFFVGNTAPTLAIMLAIAQIPAAIVGAKLSAKAPTKALKLGTAIFAGATGILMMAKL